MPVTEILRKHGLSRQTYFTWKSKYGGASVKDLTRLKELEQENAKLKRMYAELALENAAIKDRARPKVVTPSAKREAVGVQDHPFLRSSDRPDLRT